MSKSPTAGRSGRGWWIATALLVTGCLGAGAWAVPTWLEAQDLKAAAVAPLSSANSQPVEPASEGTPVDAGELAADADAVLDTLGQGAVSAQVTDVATGEVLYSRDAAEPRVPASNMKMLVDYAMLATAPQARFKTAVEMNDEATLTLVAGGDTLLVPGESDPDAVMGRAGVTTLAQQTVRALAERGATGEFTVNLDTSIFAGPSLNTDWAQEDIDSGFMTAVTPLAFFSHYSPSSNGESASANRPEDAPAQVQQTLVTELNRAGADTGLSFTAGDQSAGEGGTEIAAVESATAAEQSALMMQESDNSLAEVLGRNLSVLRGGDGSETDAGTQIRAVLDENGLPTDYEQTDISGLSMNNRVSNELLTELALRAVDGSDTERLALGGLPVAGYSGTLGLPTRFDEEDEAAARGLVHAKTGTLNSVLSLSGYTVTEGGRTLVFSVIMNDLDDAEAAKSVMDRFAATLTDR